MRRLLLAVTSLLSCACASPAPAPPPQVEAPAGHLERGLAAYEAFFYASALSHLHRAAHVEVGPRRKRALEFLARAAYLVSCGPPPLQCASRDLWGDLGRDLEAHAARSEDLARRSRALGAEDRADEFSACARDLRREPPAGPQPSQSPATRRSPRSARTPR